MSIQNMQKNKPKVSVFCQIYIFSFKHLLSVFLCYSVLNFVFIAILDFN